MPDVLHVRPIYFRWKQPAGGEWHFSAQSYEGFRAQAVGIFKHSHYEPHPHNDLRLWFQERNVILARGGRGRRWTKLTEEGFSPDPERRRLQIEEAAERLWFLAVQEDRLADGRVD